MLKFDVLQGHQPKNLDFVRFYRITRKLCLACNCVLCGRRKISAPHSLRSLEFKRARFVVITVLKNFRQ